MLTIASGYDPLYLTRAVATGRENYYLSAVTEHGEPPGIWTGAGCPELGLVIGSQVDNKMMEGLYGAFLDPRDPSGKATLGRAPSGFDGHNDKIAARIAVLLAAEPDAIPERRDQLIMQARKEQRAAVYFFDATFSVPKSVSLLHASFQIRAQQARDAGRDEEAGRWTAYAQTVWDAVVAGNQAMLDYLQREAGYSRAGYHGQGSGRFADAHQWVIASFAQHTSRDNDPQLHVHNAILNRVLREDPLASRSGDRHAWRTLDGAALYAAKPAAAAIAERTLAEQLSDRLDVQTAARPDGNGWEIVGISEELRDKFSSRRRAIAPRVQELIAEYERKHGKAPDARAVWSMAQFVTLDSRRAKAHSASARAALLARWEAQSRRAETMALSAIPEAVLGKRKLRARARPPEGRETDRVLAAAVADVQRSKATFSRYELTRMINRYLSDFLGGLSGEQVTSLLDELTDEALRPGGPARTILLTAPEMVPVPEAYRRADGLSLCGAGTVRRSTPRGPCSTLRRACCAPRRKPARRRSRRNAPPTCWALTALGWRRGCGVSTRRYPARLVRREARMMRRMAQAAPLSSAGLTDDQVQAAYGVLTSGRAIDILVGAAGTGKTRVVAAIADAWREAGAGRVIGLTTSTNASHVLAAAGLTESHNFARFLGRIKDSDQTRGHMPVWRGDLLVVDEASMVSTEDLAAVEEIATRRSAKILLTGDTQQLSAPQAGGVMRLLADEHGYYQLSTVQRFEQAWEREASLRLRAGDAGALAGYDQRGRILGGTGEQMTETAYQRWLADHLSGKASMLLVTTNAQAAELSRRARDELAALRLVATSNLIELRDGNLAGVGDLIVARQNEPILAGASGRRLANRDVLRIDAWDEIGEARVALARRMTGRDPRTGEIRWSDPFELPESYIEQHAELAYAANVHVAEGRTVDTAHLVVDETAGRKGFYVGMSRGRERNTAYVITERTRAADLTPQPRPASAIEDPGAAEDAPPPPHRLAVLAGILEREGGERTATETVRHELERAASLATLAPIWADVTRADATRQYEATLQSMLPDQVWRQYQQDPERETLTRLLHTAELAGHDVGTVLREAVTIRDFDGARSIAAVLHGRVETIVGTPEAVISGSYADRTPAIIDPQADRFARDLAAAMDERVSLLGNRAALDRPVWALRYLGNVPDDLMERTDWVRRAGLVAAYREERGYAHEIEAIGPAPERASPEQRASWHAAYTALHLPEQQREVTAMSDGELWARRDAYARETAWAPPYVADDLRHAHLAEDTYRAEAVRAWYRADAAASKADRAEDRQEAEQYSALGQEVGAYRETLTEVAEARRRWHEASEPARQRGLAADTELRRRYPDQELPPLHSDKEVHRTESGAETAQANPAPRQAGHERGPDMERSSRRLDVQAALAAAWKAEKILAEREQRTDREAQQAGEDLMRRREAEAVAEASARRTAVRQDPAPSRRAAELERDDLELEAGH